MSVTAAGRGVTGGVARSEELDGQQGEAAEEEDETEPEIETETTETIAASVQNPPPLRAAR